MLESDVSRFLLKNSEDFFFRRFFFSWKNSCLYACTNRSSLVDCLLIPHSWFIPFYLYPGTPVSVSPASQPIPNGNQDRLWHVIDWLINWWNIARVIVQTHSDQRLCQLPAFPCRWYVAWMRLKRTNPVFFLQPVFQNTGTWTALGVGEWELNLWPNELGQFCRRYHVFRDF